MRLTQWTDYTLRVLMYCAASQGRERPVTITEMAEAHGISRSHLTKIVVELGQRGWLVTTRGRGGGLRLGVPAHEIGLGAVVRATESDFQLVECFSTELASPCRLQGSCRLQSSLHRALQAFLQELDRVTLADLVAPEVGHGWQRVLGLPGA